MKHLAWTVFLISSAAAGCAGSLDKDQDYYSGEVQPIADAGTKKGAWIDTAGSSATKTAWLDAGTSHPSANTTSRPSGAQSPAEDSGVGSDDADSGMPTKWDAGNPVKQPSAGSAAVKTDAGPACDFKTLVQTKCANVTCHGAPATTSGLDLTSPSLAMRISGRTGAGACTDKLLIDKDDPTNSKIYLKVTGTTCGARMPLGGTLTSADQACVLSWIEGL
jgi:hypothetical protein